MRETNSSCKNGFDYITASWSVKNERYCFMRKTSAPATSAPAAARPISQPSAAPHPTHISTYGPSVIQ